MPTVKYKPSKCSLKIPWEMTATEHLPRTEATYQLHRYHISFWRGLWYKGHLSYPPKNSREPKCTEQHISQVTHNSYNKTFIVLRPLPQNTMCCIEANYKNVFGSPDAPALDQISRLLHSQSGAPIPTQMFYKEIYKCFSGWLPLSWERVFSVPLQSHTEDVHAHKSFLWVSIISWL